VNKISEAIMSVREPKSTTEQLILQKQGGKFSGLRQDGTAKGIGWKGSIPVEGKNLSHYATERSIGAPDINGKERLLPSIVPTLNDKETRNAASGKLDKDIVRKAIKFADDRERQGLSPFRD